MKIEEPLEHTMTPEAQRIAIAEACGWQHVREVNGYVIGALPEAKRSGNWADARTGIMVPNYLSDLNAMHEAEKVLTPDQLLTYFRRLDEVCLQPRAMVYLVIATTAQRAEAFLRTLGKWKSSPPASS